MHKIPTGRTPPDTHTQSDGAAAGPARTPRHQAGTSATTQPVIQRQWRLAGDIPRTSVPQRTTRQRRSLQRSYLAARAAGATSTCTSVPPSRPLAPCPGRRTTEWSATRRSPFGKPMRLRTTRDDPRSWTYWGRSQTGGYSRAHRHYPFLQRTRQARRHGDWRLASWFAART